MRATRDGDRRTSMVRLTPKGLRGFEAMAAAHEGWVNEYLGEVSAIDARDLTAMLKNFSSDWEE